MRGVPLHHPVGGPPPRVGEDFESAVHDKPQIPPPRHHACQLCLHRRPSRKIRHDRATRAEKPGGHSYRRAVQLYLGRKLQRWALVGLTALIAAVVAVWMWREKAKGEILALALVLGGALGNITDRVRYGYVVDYADLHFGQFRPFYIFNLADACISIGVVILLARAFLMREKAHDIDGDVQDSASQPDLSQDKI
jgi:Signal peptidase (SPase) II